MQLLHQTCRSRIDRLNAAGVTAGSSGKYGDQQRFSASTRSDTSSVRQKRYDDTIRSVDGSVLAIVAGLVWHGQRAHLVEVAAADGRDHLSFALGVRNFLLWASSTLCACEGPWPAGSGPAAAPLPASGRPRSSRPSSSCRSRCPPRRAPRSIAVKARSRASPSTLSCVLFRMNPAGTRRIRCAASVGPLERRDQRVLLVVASNELGLACRAAAVLASPRLRLPPGRTAP